MLPAGGQRLAVLLPARISLCGVAPLALGMPTQQRLVRIPKSCKSSLRLGPPRGLSSLFNENLFRLSLFTPLDPSRPPVRLFPQPVPRIMVQSALTDAGTTRAVEVSRTGWGRGWRLRWQLPRMWGVAPMP